jgi:drug/metabolite transporter (DMT)-like permease
MRSEPRIDEGAVGRPMSGVVVAGVTALISGVSIFINSYGLHSISSPAVYTTAKNLVATVVLGLCAMIGWRGRSRRGSLAANFISVALDPRDARRPSTQIATRKSRIGRWLGLSYVGVVGGGLAFVLFFDGLATSEPASAAFWRDTLVIWVALLAWPVLRERVRGWNIVAIVLLVAGEVIATGGVGHLGANRGEMTVLAATILWAGEVVIAKHLLRGVSPAVLALVRMGVGGFALVAYLALDGTVGQLVTLNTGQLAWAVGTGVILSAYVATWMTALARARALDVTSVLVASAPLTWLLQVTVGTTTPAPSSLGLVLVGIGAALVLWARPERPTRRPRAIPRS